MAAAEATNLALGNLSALVTLMIAALNIGFYLGNRKRVEKRQEEAEKLEAAHYEELKASIAKSESMAREDNHRLANQTNGVFTAVWRQIDVNSDKMQKHEVKLAEVATQVKQISQRHN